MPPPLDFSGGNVLVDQDQPSSAPDFSQGNTLVQAPYVIGDSIADGIRSAGRYDGSTKVGASPAAVLRTINGLSDDQVRGRDIVLSTGISNDTSGFGDIPKQIKALKDKGAASITVLGVGTRPDFAGLNDRLTQFSQQSGARFVGLDPKNLTPDGVHPTNYGALNTAVSTALDQPAQQPGVMPGTPHLLGPATGLRPFRPGEWLANPDGSWSNEITMTVQDPNLNGGKPTVVPSLWLRDGKPVKAANEDEAAQFAATSGLKFPSFDTMKQAENFSETREKNWQSVEPQQSASVPPLWQPAQQPPPAVVPGGGLPLGGAPQQPPGVLGTFPPASPIPQGDDMAAVRHILSAGGQAFGTEPLGLSGKSAAALQQAGIFPQPGGGIQPLRQINEAAIRGLSAAADAAWRGGAASFAMFQAGLYETAKSFGLPEQAARDIAATPEAFLGTPHFGVTPREAVPPSARVRVEPEPPAAAPGGRPALPGPPGEPPGAAPTGGPAVPPAEPGGFKPGSVSLEEAGITPAPAAQPKPAVEPAEETQTVAVPQADGTVKQVQVKSGEAPPPAEPPTATPTPVTSAADLRASFSNLTDEQYDALFREASSTVPEVPKDTWAQRMRAAISDRLAKLGGALRPPEGAPARTPLALPAPQTEEDKKPAGEAPALEGEVIPPEPRAKPSLDFAKGNAPIDIEEEPPTPAPKAEAPPAAPEPAKPTQEPTPAPSRTGDFEDLRTAGYDRDPAHPLAGRIEHLKTLAESPDLSPREQREVQRRIKLFEQFTEETNALPTEQRDKVRSLRPDDIISGKAEDGRTIVGSILGFGQGGVEITDANGFHHTIPIGDVQEVRHVGRTRTSAQTPEPAAPAPAAETPAPPPSAPTPAAAPPAADAVGGPWTDTGKKNHLGDAIYENPNGVRAVMENGVPWTESVKPGPNGEWVPKNPDNRKRHHLTTDEAWAGPSPAGKPPAKPEEEKPPPESTKPPEDWTYLGDNEDGLPVYTNPQGVHSVVENGVRDVEPVRLRPTRSGMQVSVPAPDDKAPRYRVAKPKAAEEKPATPPKREETPPAPTEPTTAAEEPAPPAFAIGDEVRPTASSGLHREKNAGKVTHVQVTPAGTKISVNGGPHFDASDFERGPPTAEAEPAEPPPAGPPPSPKSSGTGPARQPPPPLDRWWGDLAPGDRLWSDSGRELSPVPKFTWPTAGKRARLQPLQDWLVNEARREAAQPGRHWARSFVNQLNPRNLSQSDVDMILDVLFGSDEGPKDKHRVPPGARQPTATAAEPTPPSPSTPARSPASETPTTIPEMARLVGEAFKSGDMPSAMQEFDRLAKANDLSPEDRKKFSDAARSEMLKAGWQGDPVAGEEAERLFDEAQELMRKLPRDMGKAKREGKLTPAQQKMIDRLDEIEKLLPSASPEWKRIRDERIAAQRETQAEDAAKRAEEQRAKLDEAGLKEGDRVYMIQPPPLPTMPGRRINGTVKIGKDGTAYVAADGKRLDPFANPWKMAEAPPPLGQEPAPQPAGTPPATGTTEPPENELKPATEQHISVPLEAPGGEGQPEHGGVGEPEGGGVRQPGGGTRRPGREEDTGRLAPEPAADVAPSESGGDRGEDVIRGEPTVSGTVGQVREGGDATDGRQGTGGEGLADAGAGRNPRGVKPASTRPNFHIADPESLIGGTPKARFARNRRALEALAAIEEEQRPPTQEELEAMAGYIGWGSFGQDLFQGTFERPWPRKGWEDESAWLRAQLGKEGWESAQRSIINAHYTDPPTVQAMWDMVRQMGFTGGRILEPSMGIGNFFGMMPRDIMDKSTLTGIELDATTGEMAKLLYPDAGIHIKGYEQSKTPDNFYDLVIGNWPFAAESPPDRRYDKLSPTLHDYFFLKALDQTRPGGLVVGITSAGTMDKVGRAARVEMAKKGELIASFRLPSGAFEQYAGTSVVTDILVFRKRAEPPANVLDEPWINATDMETESGQPIRVNEYYQKAHPENVLGTLDWGHGTTSGRPGMIVHRPADLMQRLAALPLRLPEGVYQPKLRGNEPRFINASTADRQNSITVGPDGKLYQVQGERLALLEDVHKPMRTGNAKEVKRRDDQVRSLVEMRRTYGALLDAERLNAGNTEEIRKRLSDQYAAFTKEHGPINGSFGLKAFAKVGDPGWAALSSLELPNKQPARILSERVVRAKKSITKPSIADAYVLARNEAAIFDIDRVAELANEPRDVVAQHLLDAKAVYRTPGDGFEPADSYLSGNVRRKLREAQDAVERGEDMQASVDALTAALPPTVPYYQIEAKFGATWISDADYRQFIGDMLGVRGDDLDDIHVRFSGGRWKVTFTDRGFNHRDEATTIHGHPRYPFSKLLQAAMGNIAVRIMDPKDRDGGPYLNEKATEEANTKIAELREKFVDWAWSDPERRLRFEAGYNEVMNAIGKPHYDGSFMDMSGMALRRGDDPFSLRRHQVNAIWRGIALGRGLFAHEVGTGKTYTIAGIAVEGRRYGKFSKPLIFAHNANSEAVSQGITEMYPGAKVLYLDNLSPATIKASLYRIANEDWDAVVMPHSLIDRMTLTRETLMELAQEQILALENEAMEAAEEDGAKLTPEMMDDPEAMKKIRSPTAKQLVRQRQAIINNIEKQANRASQEGAVPFEQLGVDAIIVDEAHVFKKPPIETKMRMKGLSTETSDRSIGLNFLTGYVKKNNNGNGAYLFTGTPVTNSLNEVFNMSRYFMDDTMRRDGIADWDAWFNTFADAGTEPELSAAGEYEPIKRLSSFANVDELVRMMSEFTDVVQAKDMPEFIDRTTKSGKTLGASDLSAPERDYLENGYTDDPVGRPYKKIINDVGEITPTQRGILDILQAHSRYFKSAPAKERREMMLSGDERVPIRVETDAANASLDARMYDPDALDDPNNKINRVARNVLRIHQEPNAGQAIFLDRGYHGGKRNPTFSVVDELVRKLVEGGIPRNEIKVVAGGVTPEEKTEIADAMNRGELRVVIGQSETLGVGVNMQQRLRAMHHMDAPWRPGDLEQRNGRGHRQGNRWNTVQEYRYITEGIDGRRWQRLTSKDRFIKQFIDAFNDESGKRIGTIEGDAADISDDENILQTLAAAAGDPRLMVREKLKTDVGRLERRERVHTQGIVEARRRAESLRSSIGRLREQVGSSAEALETWDRSFAKMQEEATAAGDTHRWYDATIGGKTVRTGEDIQQALDDAVINLVAGEKDVRIGTINGLHIVADWGARWNKEPVYELQTPDGNLFATLSGLTLPRITGALRSVRSEVEGMPRVIAEREATIQSLEKASTAEFAQAANLARKRQQLAQLEDDMAANPIPPPAWLRHGAPIDSTFFVNGEERTVRGHRMTDDYYLSTDDGDVPYLDATDQNNQRIFEPHPKPQPMPEPPQGNTPGLAESPPVFGQPAGQIRPFGRAPPAQASPGTSRWPITHDQITDVPAHTPETAHATAASWVRREGKATGNEHIAVVDNATGRIIHAGTDAKTDFLSFDPGRLRDGESVIIHHNHPASGGLSVQDVVMIANPGVTHVTAIGHDGTTHVVSLSDETRGLLEGAPLVSRRAAIAAAYEEARKTILPTFRKMVDDGRLAAAQANLTFNDAVSRLLDAAGVVNYVSSRQLPAPVRAFLRDTMKEMGQDAAGIDRRTQSVRPEEGIASLPRPMAGQRAGQIGRGVAGATQMGAGSAEPPEVTEMRNRVRTLSDKAYTAATDDGRLSPADEMYISRHQGKVLGQ